MLERLKDLCAEQGYPLSELQVAQFAALRDRLYEANQHKNYTRIAFEDCEERHFGESCLILDQIPHGARVLDIGTGPGFPALPLAIARPDITLLAIDSNGKMLEFLSASAPTNLQPILGRMEDQPWLDRFEVVTGRALAPLSTQLELSARACIKYGLVIPFRSDGEDYDVAAAHELGLAYEGVLKRQTSPDAPVRVFPLYRKVAKTPSKYPRPWPTMKASPL